MKELIIIYPDGSRRSFCGDSHNIYWLHDVFKSAGADYYDELIIRDVPSNGISPKSESGFYSDPADWWKQN